MYERECMNECECTNEHECTNECVYINEHLCTMHGKNERVVREKSKSGIKTVTKVLLSLEVYLFRFLLHKWVM